MGEIPATAKRLDGWPRTPAESYPNEVIGADVPGRLGRLPVRSDTRALLFSRFVDLPKLPVATNFWRGRAKFPLRSFGNLNLGSCTRSKQAVAHMRIERLETRRTPMITDEEVMRVYREMSDRLYGGGDNGAFETDALSEWRDPELTFKDKQGRPLTIDAFLRLNPFNHDELKAALVVAGPKGFPFCINLPRAFARLRSTDGVDWDIPAGQQPIGEFLPGSWGGHSMWAFDYDAIGLWFDHTWEMPPQRITWAAAAIYIDEAHSVIDSLDAWRKKAQAKRLVDLKGIAKAVNAVSRIKVAA